MSHIHAEIRLRPVRFAFLVRPNDSTSLRKVFQTNTCLWGGRFNPVIPIFGRTPQWWDRHPGRLPQSKEIINGHIDFFEPDFVVETSQGLANGLGFDAERVLQIGDILQGEATNERSGFGLNILELYKDLYRKEYQFVRRHENRVVKVSAADDEFSTFSACLFGDFPNEPPLGYLEEGFIEAFAPEVLELTPTSLVGLYRSRKLSAMRITEWHIDARFSQYQSPIIFVMNARDPRDLIDLWNLRAIHRRVVPIPLEWVSDLSEFAKGFIKDHYRPIPGNPNGVMNRVTVLFARSIHSELIESIHQNHFLVDVSGANVFQNWYPPFWRPPSDHVVGYTRPILTAGKKTMDLPYEPESRRIQFEPLHPEFSEEWGNKHRWANVVELVDWESGDQVATVYPSNVRKSVYPKFRLGDELFLSTTEGLVFTPMHRAFREHWEIPDGNTAIRDWLVANDVKSSSSPAGQSTQQIIQTLGGLWGVSSLVSEKTVKLLNGITRKPMFRSMHQREFEEKLRAPSSGLQLPNRAFETLVDRRAVELGLEVKCSKCDHWSWYSLDQLREAMTCALCLREFRFPVHSPASSKFARWSYRLIGPFALPDYARGGYAAALAIRLFGLSLGVHLSRRLTWSAGQELELPGGRRVESDFILWYQRERTFGVYYPTEVVFGETKSFGADAFKEDDIQRMKDLAIRFPGAVLVFATMKKAEELSPKEIQRLSRLALWGRELIPHQNQTRAPLILLTGVEMFSRAFIQQTWREMGGRHSEIATASQTRLENLRELADCTQQLYLNLPSYSQWLRERWARRLERRNRRGSLPSSASA